MKTAPVMLLRSAVLATVLALAPATEAAQTKWTGVGRVIAFADVHGAYDQLAQLLRESGVIDAQDHWSAGRTHVVSLGDLLDRGADSRRVMDLLMRLQQEAAAAGGQLHVVLGNHEAMNLLGDLRYVSRGEYESYRDLEPPELRTRMRDEWVAQHGADSVPEFEKRFPAGYFGQRAALAPDGRYGQWLLALPVAISIDDSLFMHAGPSSLLKGMTLDQVDARYHAALDRYLATVGRLQGAGLVQPGDEFHQRPQLAAQRLAAPDRKTDDAVTAARLAQDVEQLKAADEDPMLSPEGPNWYRGAALCNEASETDVLAPLLQQFGVQRLVVGHTPTRELRAVTRFDGRVVKMDSGMNPAAYHGRADALIIEGGKLAVRYPGETAINPPPPEGLYVAPNEIADARVLAALRGGTVTVGGPRGPGSFDVTVDFEGAKIPAVFTATTKEARQNELAAHALDRMLGLGIVPATVEREVQGQQGVLQARPAKWVTQGDVQRQSLRGGGWCAAGPQYQLVFALDTLVGNEGRTADTLLFDTEDWYVYATGYDKAFGKGTALPAYLKAQPPTPGAEVRRRLAALDEAKLQQAVGTWVDAKARKAMLARRDALLALPAAAATGTGR